MTTLVVCLICDHQRIVWMMRRGMVCHNCGVSDPRAVLEGHQRQGSWAWEDKPGLPRIEAQRRAYAGLKWITEHRHYKPKWAEAKFMDIFDEWPPKEIEHVPGEPPTQGLLRRVAVDNARWKKQKREEEEANKPVIAIIPHDPVQSSFMTEDDWAVKL